MTLPADGLDLMFVPGATLRNKPPYYASLNRARVDRSPVLAGLKLALIILPDSTAYPRRFIGDSRNFKSDLWDQIRSWHCSRGFSHAVFPLGWRNRAGRVLMPFSDEKQPAL
jgi:hypothetical protein